MRHACTILFVIGLFVPAVFAKKETRDWKTGKVLDSRLAKSSIAVGSTTNTNSTATVTGSDGMATGTGQSTSSTQVDFANIRDNQLVILGAEFAYIVEADTDSCRSRPMQSPIESMAADSSSETAFSMLKKNPGCT